MSNNFSCLLLSIYLPCDNYCNAANADYVDCIESLLISEHCNAFMCCGYYNNSFEQNNAQTECLNNFIKRNKNKNKNKNEFITITETMMEIIHY